MKTFIEYLQEGSVLAPLVLAAGMMGSAATPPSAPAEHIVGSGNTISSIARQYGTDVATILKNNPSIKDPNKISIGQKINLGARAASTKPTTQAAAVEDPYAHLGGQQNVNVYKALVAAEHRGTDIGNPLEYNAGQYIRTRAGANSSAYGPAQITKSTAAGFARTQPDLFTGQEDYMKEYETQGNSMLGNAKEGDVCGPGGCGTLSDEKYHKPYQQMAASVIRGKKRELKIDDTKEMSPEDRERFFQSWRGASRQDDPEYFAAIDAAYKTN